MLAPAGVGGGCGESSLVLVGGGALLSLVSVLVGEDGVFVVEAFPENMSLMVRRLLNSGSSLPDSGRRSWVGSKSRSLMPSLNMPAGFIRSAMCTCSPRQSTTLFVDAYTGQ